MEVVVREEWGLACARAWVPKAPCCSANDLTRHKGDDGCVGSAKVVPRDQLLLTPHRAQHRLDCCRFVVQCVVSKCWACELLVCRARTVNWDRTSVVMAFSSSTFTATYGFSSASWSRQAAARAVPLATCSAVKKNCCSRVGCVVWYVRVTREILCVLHGGGYIGAKVCRLRGVWVKDGDTLWPSQDNILGCDESAREIQATRLTTKTAWPVI